jgi:hypothetical protein
MVVRRWTHPDAILPSFNPGLKVSSADPEHAAPPRWKFPLSPIDLGPYPLANGQVYGGVERKSKNIKCQSREETCSSCVDALARTREL